MTAPEPPRLLPLVGADPYRPRDVHLVGRYALGVDWQDGHGSIFPFDALREACPCATCQTVGVRTLGPAATWPADIRRDDAGLRVRWQDGHETTFAGRELRPLCRCASCTGGH